MPALARCDGYRARHRSELGHAVAVDNLIRDEGAGVMGDDQKDTGPRTDLEIPAPGLRDLGDRKPPTAEQYQKLAEGLEHPFLAGVPPAAIDAGYRALVGRLPPVPRPSDAATPAEVKGP